MTIQVTEHDITNGRGDSSVLCPIALALSRQTRQLWIVTLDRIISAQLGGKGIVYKTSTRVRKFILDCAEGKKVKPFNFRLMK